MRQFAWSKRRFLVFIFEVFRNFLDGIDFDEIFVSSIFEKTDSLDVGDWKGTNGRNELGFVFFRL